MVAFQFAIRHQGHIRIQLVEDARFFENLLRPQHFLNLVPHRQFILENKCNMLAQVNFAVFFMRDHSCPEFGPYFGIGFQGHQAIGGNRPISQALIKKVIAMPPERFSQAHKRSE